MCVYLYIHNTYTQNTHTHTHTYIMQTKTFILCAINRLTALIVTYDTNINHQWILNPSIRMDEKQGRLTFNDNPYTLL